VVVGQVVGQQIAQLQQPLVAGLPTVGEGHLARPRLSITAKKSSSFEG